MNPRYFLTPCFLLAIVLSLLGCRPKEQSAEVAQVAFTANNKEQIESKWGTSIPYTVKEIDPDSVSPPRTIPLSGTPKVFSLTGNVAPAGKPRVVSIPENLTVITPGEHGIPLPDTFWVERRRVPACHAPAVPASAPQMTDAAISSISSLGIDQGMNSSFLFSMIEDDREEIWFGTGGGGVIRFDGSNFVHYTAKEGFSNAIVWTIFKDTHGILWFGTLGDGIISYDGSHFTHYSGQGNFADSQISRILEDQQGNIWFGCRKNGLICFDGTRFIQYTSEQGLSGDEVWSLEIDQQDNIWVGTRYDGLNRFDGTSFTHYTSREGLSSNFVKAILEDTQGNLWIGTYGGQLGGVNLYTPPKPGSGQNGTFTYYTVEEGLSHPNVLSIMEDSKGNLWFGTDGKGANRFDGKYFSYFSTEEGLVHNNVLDIMEDSRGNIWFGTWGGGAERYAVNNAITHFSMDKFIDNFDVRSIFEDSRDNIWVGTYGNGVFCLQLNDQEIRLVQYTTTEGLLSNEVITIEEDRKGNLWFGYRTAGMSRFEPDGTDNHLGGTFTHFTRQEGLSSHAINWIEADKRGNIWLGSNEGDLCRYDPADGGGRFTHFVFEKNCLNAFYSGLEDRQGNLWLATQCGLIRFNPDNDQDPFIHFSEKDGLGDGDYVSAFEDQNGVFWFGSFRNGLAKYEREKGFSHYTTTDGLLSNQIFSIAEDRQKRIWVASVKGLNTFVPAFRGEATTGNQPFPAFEFLSLSRADGIKGMNFEHESVYIDRQNRLWIGSGKGLSMVDLNKLKLPERIPKVKLNTIDIDQMAVDYARLGDTSYRSELSFGRALAASFDSVIHYYNYPLNLALPHQLNHLTFHFSAIDWAAPQKLQYSYWLVGQDDNWSLPGRDTKVDYRNLPAGEYTFKVKAIGAANRWSNVFEYNFQILPPWWQNWWAYLVYALVIFTLLYGLYQFQLNRQLEKAEAHRLKELDAVKTKLYTNITHEFRTPLTIILGMARKVKEDPGQWFSEGVRMINRNGENLLRLVNQMLDLRKLESGDLPVHLVQGDILLYLKYLLDSFQSYAEAKDIKLHFLTDDQAVLMDYDPGKLQHIVSNLLSNAIKFTPAGGDVYLTVSAARQTGNGHFLNMQVKDNGIGIPAEKLPYVFDRFYQADDRAREGSGIGLALTRELVQLLGGEISVSSQLDQGTTFTIVLPITNDASMADPLEHTGPSITSSGENLIPAVDLEAASDTSGELPLALIIEDNIDVRRYLQVCLQNGYRLEMAENGRAGIDKALELIPDVIISDVMMPEKDGYEVCRTLKQDMRTSHIPIILLTAKIDGESRLAGLETGADAYLAKPFQPEELEVRLKKMIELRRKLQIKYGGTTALSPKDEQYLSPDERFLQKLNGIINANLGDEAFGIGELCREMAVSRTQLHRKLKALTDTSASHYIRNLRLTKALELLRTSDLSISQVAYEVGFRHHSYFTESFTARFGMAPSQAR